MLTRALILRFHIARRTPFQTQIAIHNAVYASSSDPETRLGTEILKCSLKVIGSNT